jgi:ferredoxin
MKVQQKNFMKAQQQEKYVRESILPWQILRLFCQFTTPPKNKHILIASIYPHPLLLMVNSQIHSYIKSRPCLKSCQVLLRASEHLFLAHDSYVDCRNVCTTFSLNDIVAQVHADRRRIKGFISDEAQAQVIAAIKVCPTLEKQYKNLILAEIAELET